MAEDRHGRSTAAWTAVTFLLVASFLICLAVVVTSWPLAIAGIVLALVGVVAGKLLGRAGFGRSKPDASGQTTAVR
jgi:DMSO reductase anchor subunit